jgi:hypothetical protein
MKKGLTESEIMKNIQTYFQAHYDEVVAGMPPKEVPLHLSKFAEMFPGQQDVVLKIIQENYKNIFAELSLADTFSGLVELAKALPDVQFWIFESIVTELLSSKERHISTEQPPFNVGAKLTLLVWEFPLAKQRAEIFEIITRKKASILANVSQKNLSSDRRRFLASSSSGRGEAFVDHREVKMRKVSGAAPHGSFFDSDDKNVISHEVPGLALT